MTATRAPAPYRFTTPGELPVLTWPIFDGLPVAAMVTTRDGGVSTGRYGSLNLGLHVGDEDALVLENRRRVAAALEADLDDFVFCAQAHRRTALVVDECHRGRGARARADAVPDTDALVTATPGLVLAVMVADCVPLVLFEPRAHVLACVHAGWRGTVRGVTTEAVAAMRRLGADPARVLAGLGPAVSPDSYQVGDDVADLARAAFGGDLNGIMRPDGSGRWLFDLWAANTRQLRAAGVPAENIQVAVLPTGRGSRFFSHRAEQPCGRFAAVARLHGRTAS